MVNVLHVLSFLLLAINIQGLYFHIGETEKKCFIEEIPDDTLLVGEYKVEIFDKVQQKFVPTSPGFGMHVELLDPDRGVVMSRAYADRGQFSATSHSSGEHMLCLHSNSTGWFNTGQLRVHLDLRVGEHAQDYAAIAAKDKLNDLELRLRQLLDQVEQISREQSYQRLRENVFRIVSENINSRVLWWSVLQTILLLAIGFWQMRHLKSFFQAKKLV